MKSENAKLPQLLIPRDLASQRLGERINLGSLLAERNIQGSLDLREAESERREWSQYNYDLLRWMFSNAYYADEYAGFGGGVFVSNQDLSYYIEEYREDVRNKISRLRSIRNRLELILETEDKLGQTDARDMQRVFLVHGHDHGVRDSVARFVEKLDLDTVILQERPNRGRTLMEKFEQEASQVGFAIVLMTPDDLGASKIAANDMQTRARQNVIFELGYFAGKLGRGKVCMLSKGEIEIPSDLAGVVYVSLDSGEWKSELAREMKAAGLEFDFDSML